jgi:hypothetical protein
MVRTIQDREEAHGREAGSAMTYTKDSALKMLERNGLKVSENRIYVPEGRIIGIRILGAVDYLLNYCDYLLIYEKV